MNSAIKNTFWANKMAQWIKVQQRRKKKGVGRQLSDEEHYCSFRDLGFGTQWQLTAIHNSAHTKKTKIKIKEYFFLFFKEKKPSMVVYTFNSHNGEAETSLRV